MKKNMVVLVGCCFGLVLFFAAGISADVLADEMPPEGTHGLLVEEGIIIEQPDGPAFAAERSQADPQRSQENSISNLMSWSTLMSEGFEGAFPSAGWELFSYSTTGIYYWGTEDYRSFSPSKSVHPGGSGAHAYDPRESFYQNNMNSWMVYGPLDLSTVSDARVEFKMWLDTEPVEDSLLVCAKRDYTAPFYCYSYSGESGGWHFVSLSLADWVGLGTSLIGDSDVWIGFIFFSNEETAGPGVFLDDLVVRSTSSSAEPDLYPFEYHPIPNLYHPGDSLTAYTNFVNVGSASCTNFDVTEYISTDASITPDDIAINTMSYGYTILPDDNLVMASAPTIPLSTTEGMYYMGAIYSCVGDTEASNDVVVYPNQIEVTNPGTGGIIFQDNFESRDLTSWTRFNDGKTGLSVCSLGAINGDYGACFYRPENDRRRQLIDETPVYQTTFNVRFSFDPNGLGMTEGERFRFMQTKLLTDRPYYLVMRYMGGVYEIQLKVRTDTGDYMRSGWNPLSDSPHTIEVDWIAASGPGSNDGLAELWIDGTMVESIDNLDNDTLYVDIFKIGFTSRLEGKSISGTFFLDDVTTSNGGYIGLP